VRRAAYPVPDAVAEEALERFAPPLAGRRVLLKPNCLAGEPPERGVTTHPSLVAALVRALRRRGAAVVTGDNPGARGYGTGRRCFELSGLLAAADGSFGDIGAATAVVALRSRIAQEVVVSRAVLEADYVVSVPKLKTHCLTLLTGAVKNMYGVLAGAEKARLHWEARTPERFAELLADVYAVRRPDLAVMDAVVAMEGDGPSHGRLRDVGLVLASDDPVALDATAARIAGVAPERVAHLRLAAARGLGRIAAGEIRVDGPLATVPGFRLPSTFRAGVLGALSNLVVFNLLHRSRLRVNVRKCRRCGECERACPSGAMGRRDGAFAIDTGRCHLCFCCSELCPAGAVEVQGALGALLRRQGTR
jgi:uncharacterized protein (DUF362 family)/ferredoxin